jgi:hypothetical protein
MPHAGIETDDQRALFHLSLVKLVWLIRARLFAEREDNPSFLSCERRLPTDQAGYSSSISVYFRNAAAKQRQWRGVLLAL